MRVTGDENVAHTIKATIAIDRESVLKTQPRFGLQRMGGAAQPGRGKLLPLPLAPIGEAHEPAATGLERSRDAVGYDWQPSKAWGRLCGLWCGWAEGGEWSRGGLGKQASVDQ